ncbi:nuclear respiratory factor 1-like isoform X2 [Lineus longissimus]|uniref:nuclear respiratory factor 1-like isoform X2 n=1 Tax=Lineus longissimus TaxID=88925 RepID=UPI002B4E01E5
MNINSSMASHLMAEDMSDASSNESTQFDDTDLLNSTVHDDVTAQLVAAGPIGVAAAAAIATGKKRKRPHSFETNPSIRKRQQTRLLRKLKATIDEYTTRVGQQAIVLSVTPGKPSQSSNAYKCFGSQPLETVIRNCRNVIMQDLEASLSQQTPPAVPDNPALHELPALIIDGIPTPVDKMTQAQLRAFIPEMLKYSTGRSKPGWGKPECRPVWWPSDLPWANVRSDVRTDEDKKKVSWTHALRTIVKNCYKHHGRDDLLPEFEEHMQSHPGHYGQPTMVQTINNPDGTVSIIQIDTGSAGNAVVTLGDGTQATVVHAIQHNGQTHEANQAVQTLAEVAASQQEVGVHSQTLELNSDAAAHAVATLAEATINQDGQIILTGDALGDGTNIGDGRMMKLCLSKDIFGNAGDQKFGMVTIPVSMYQTVVTSIAQMQDANNQNIQIAMAPKMETMSHPGGGGDVPDATHAVEVMTVEQT